MEALAVDDLRWQLLRTLGLPDEQRLPERFDHHQTRDDQARPGQRLAPLEAAARPLAVPRRGEADKRVQGEPAG